MKKIALLFVITLSMFLHGVNKYMHLNDLPRYSQVKCECEDLSRGWIFKSKAQKKCEFIDNEVDEFVAKFSTDIAAVKRKKDWIDKIATAAKLTRDVATKVADPDYANQIKDAVQGIVPGATDETVAKECAMLADLVVFAVNKELSK